MIFTYNALSNNWLSEMRRERWINTNECNPQGESQEDEQMSGSKASKW